VAPRSFNDAPVGRLSAHFTGREGDLDQLEETLNRKQDRIPGCCVIHGMPGMGKSQPSLRYAAKSACIRMYSGLRLRASTNWRKDSPSHPYLHVQDQSVKLTVARLWLEECSVRWLFVIDNVDRGILDFLTHCISLAGIAKGMFFSPLEPYRSQKLW